MIESLIISLVLTIMIEVTLSLLLGLRGENNIETVIWINCITNPVVVVITNLIYMLSQNLIVRNIVLAILEIVVIFVEGFLFKKFLKNLKIKPYIFSIYINGLSFSFGLIISLIIK